MCTGEGWPGEGKEGVGGRKEGWMNGWMGGWVEGVTNGRRKGGREGRCLDRDGGRGSSAHCKSSESVFLFVFYNKCSVFSVHNTVLTHFIEINLT